MPRRAVRIALPTSLLLLAFALRVHQLGLRSLWFDEAMEYWVATAPLSQLADVVLARLQDPPLYSFLLHFWLKIGLHEVALRLLTTLLALLNVSGVFVLGRRLHSWQAGCFAAFILAILPPDIRFAQEVGQYALLSCGLTWSLYWLLTALQQRHPSAWMLWVITASLTLYSHYGALIIFLGIVTSTIVVLLLKQHFFVLKQLLVATVGVGVCSGWLVIVWLPTQLVRGPTSDAFLLQWQSLGGELAWIGARTEAVAQFLLLGRLTAWPWQYVPLWFPLVLIVFLLGCAFVARRKVGWGLVWLGTSWVVYVVIGRLQAYPYNGTRHATILIPLLVTSIAIGFSVLWQQKRVVAILTLLILSGLALLAPREEQENARAVTEQWLAHNTNGELTYVYYGAVPAFRYQLQVAGYGMMDAPPVWYSHCWQGISVPYCQEENIIYGSWLRTLTAEAQTETILDAIGRDRGAFWLLFSHHEQDDKIIVSTLATEYEVAWSFSAENAALYRLVRKP